MTSTYQTNWDNYWSKLLQSGEPAFWDVQTNTELAALLPDLKAAFAEELPLVDFGCGNGTQTLFLAQHFSQVVGVDVSEAAIAQAQTRTQADQPKFQVLDVTGEEAVQALHATLGDANVYMRGVLHQIQPQDRLSIVRSLQTLIGDQGQLCLIELSPQAKQAFQDLTQQLGAPPPQLARVFEHGIAPAEISPAEVRTLFSKAQYEVMKEEAFFINTNTELPNGTLFKMPAFCMLIRSKRF